MRPYPPFLFVSRVLCVFIVGLALLPVSAQTKTGPTDKTIEMELSQKWSDTGIDLHPGDLLQISAATTGSGAQLCDPQGVMGLTNTGKLPLESALPAALLARLQEKSDSVEFIGADRQLKITNAGRLYLGTNLGAKPSCSGKYSVKIHLVPGGGNEVTSIKSKLASAAQIWMSGQFGGAKPTGTQNTGIVSDAGASSVANPPSQAAATPSTNLVLPVSHVALDANLAKDL